MSRTPATRTGRPSSVPCTTTASVGTRFPAASTAVTSMKPSRFSLTICCAAGTADGAMNSNTVRPTSSAGVRPSTRSDGAARVDDDAVAAEDRQVERRVGELAKPGLALAQEGVRALALGDVTDGADAHGPLAEAALLREDLRAEARAVLADPRDDVLALEPVAHVGEDARHVLGRDAHAQDVAAQKLVALVAVHLAQAVVDLDDLAVRVDEKPLEGGRRQEVGPLAQLQLFVADLREQRRQRGPGLGPITPRERLDRRARASPGRGASPPDHGSASASRRLEGTRASRAGRQRSRAGATWALLRFPQYRLAIIGSNATLALRPRRSILREVDAPRHQNHRGAHHVPTELLQYPHDGAEAGPARPLPVHGPQRVQRRREAAGQEGGHRRLRRAGAQPGAQHARLGPRHQLCAARRRHRAEAGELHQRHQQRLQGRHLRGAHPHRRPGLQPGSRQAARRRGAEGDAADEEGRLPRLQPRLQHRRRGAADPQGPDGRDGGAQVPRHRGARGVQARLRRADA